MIEQKAFYTRTSLANGLRDLFAQLEQRLALTTPMNAYLAGGMAVHLYTANRVTADVDAEYGGRIMIPNDLMVEVKLEDGTTQLIYLDTNYNSTFALLHEDYLQDSIPVDLGLEHIRVHVLSPVDLAVSKIARLAPNDREDICSLVRLGLTTADEIERRANDALAGFVGGQQMLALNVRDAVLLARDAEREATPAAVLAYDPAERARRIEDLPKLSRTSGAAYTLWRHASAAMAAAHSPDSIDWKAIEQKVIAESIGEHGQSPDSVAEALCAYSPGASSSTLQAQLVADIARWDRNHPKSLLSSHQTPPDIDPGRD
ncbi:hypothetical protein R70006_05039 [Paraburkholderia domus]|uniref:DUF6036 family nucleotidyltransferase n=1 Tax=Paraburkholderia domus TaxID=2793075 RepID=UPI001AFF07E0|nr:DUF6036 family nucleotidyltransferase [Paraburkholderia domus]CAE6795183.1 hypothetical protein R70006_05039 [Paraburkholderia domus]